jgi:raffinose/stachyose/melibiose transport system substrate-binding protein
MKKTVYTMFVIVTVIMMVTACGGNKSAAPPALELSIWNLRGRQVALDAAAEEFNAANPGIKIIPAYYGTGGIRDACKAAASSGTLPDLWHNRGGMPAGFYAENGLIYDLKDYAAEKGRDRIFNAEAVFLIDIEKKHAIFSKVHNAGILWTDILKKYIEEARYA